MEFISLAIGLTLCSLGALFIKHFFDTPGPKALLPYFSGILTFSLAAWNLDLYIKSLIGN